MKKISLLHYWKWIWKNPIWRKYPNLARKNINTSIWENNYLTLLKTHLFYHLISKCSSDLLNIDFAESVSYHWKKAKTSYSWSLFHLKEIKKGVKKFLCSLGTMSIWVLFICSLNIILTKVSRKLSSSSL